MNHLGEQISALVDGELTGAELDRANAHLAGCALCRTEAAELRQLKRDLRALAGLPFDPPVIQPGVRGDEELTRRLLAMAGPGGPVPSRRLRREQFRHERGRTGRPPERARPGGRARSGGQRQAGRPPGIPRAQRRRYVLWSAVSVVVVGIGAAAFGMGGGAPAAPGPKITPQLEMFSIEHALTSGDVPFPDPTPAPPGATKP